MLGCAARLAMSATAFPSFIAFAADLNLRQCRTRWTQFPSWHERRNSPRRGWGSFRFLRMAIFQRHAGWVYLFRACGLPKGGIFFFQGVPPGGGPGFFFFWPSGRLQNEGAPVPSPCGLRGYGLTADEAAPFDMSPNDSSVEDPKPLPQAAGPRRDQNQNSNHWIAARREPVPAPAGLNRYSPRRNRFLRRTGRISHTQAAAVLGRGRILMLAGGTSIAELDRSPHERRRRAHRQSCIWAHPHAVVVAPESRGFSLLFEQCPWVVDQAVKVDR